MTRNRSQSRNQSSKFSMILPFGVILIALVITTSFGGHRPLPQEKVNLTIESGRPVADAVQTLEQNCICVITYEDPLYVHPSEIDDVTESVRKDLDKFRPGEAPRVLVPKGGSLTLDYEAIPGTKTPVDTAGVVQELINLNQANGNPGRFRMEKSSSMIHVIPTHGKNRDGEVVSQQAILDSIISIPVKEQTSIEALEQICKSIGKATQTQVLVGTIPANSFIQHRGSYGAVNQKAREALIQLLETTGPNLSWRLLSGPGTNTYALNIHRVH